MGDVIYGSLNEGIPPLQPSTCCHCSKSTKAVLFVAALLLFLGAIALFLTLYNPSKSSGPRPPERINGTASDDSRVGAVAGQFFSSLWEV